VVYLPALPGGFLSDDYSQLQTFYGLGAHEVAARVWKTVRFRRRTAVEPVPARW
jgi:hypothetical protein